MKTVPTSVLQFMGLSIQGDIDGITCYRSARHGVIWFPKAPPTKPASPLQLAQRVKWRRILDDWLALSDAVRRNWMLITERATLSLHGLNLYIWWRCAEDDSIIETLQRQTGITVL